MDTAKMRRTKQNPQHDPTLHKASASASTTHKESAQTQHIDIDKYTTHYPPETRSTSSRLVSPSAATFQPDWVRVVKSPCSITFRMPWID